MLARLVAWLPRGGTLGPDEFHRRHRMLLGIALAHVPLLVLLVLLGGEPLVHAVAELAVFGGLLACAASPRPSDAWRARAMAVALLTASVLLIHLTGGITEAHFHFFVVLPLVALYQMWTPYLLAIGVVAVHHLGMALLAPALLFNTEVAVANPVAFALLHAVFVLAACAVLVQFWRLAELGQAAAADAAEAAVADREAEARRDAERARQRDAERARRLDQRRELAARLADRIDAVTATCTSVTAEVDAVAEASREVEEAVRGVAVRTQEASMASTEAVAASRDTGVALAGLVAAAEQIEAVVAVIESLADQTRTLALNATIEAARAGEAGAGFAVVAENVKGLADRTASALEDVRATVASVVAGVGEAGTLTGRVDGTVGRLGELSHEVATAVEEQTRLLADISRATTSAAAGVQALHASLGAVRDAAHEGHEDHEDHDGSATAADEWDAAHATSAQGRRGSGQLAPV